MLSSAMLRHVALVRANILEERIASIIKVTRISKLGTMLVTANVVLSSPILVTLMMEAIRSSETSVLTRATQRNMTEDVRFEVFKAGTMKNGVFWDVTPCGSCKNRRFRGTLRLLHQGDKNR
jgi:hypothetical protein